MVLFTALIAPYFIDWTSYRQSFEREASAYLGRPVTVEGKAAVRLLPTPVVSFTDVHVGDAAAPDVEMERFRAEVELTPLLKGQVRVIQMAFEHPVFRMDLATLEDKKGLLNGGWRLDPERISLERLEIDEGTMLVSDSRTGRRWRADGITAVLEADTLAGPGKLEANFALDGKPVGLTVGFGRLTAENDIGAKITLRSPDYPVTLATDGTFRFGGDAPPAYEGTATIEGIPPANPDAPRGAWADFLASGKFSLEPDSLNVEKVQFSYGAFERPIILEANGRIDFGDQPHFDLSLAARQIDFDRALGGKEDAVPIDTAFAALLNTASTAARPPLPGVFHLRAQGVVLGGSMVQNVAADVAATADGWDIKSFTAVLPGETEIALGGALKLNPEAAFRGHARLASARPAAFATWWQGDIGSARKIGKFAVEADVDVSRDNQHFDDLTVTTVDGTMRGTIDVRRPPGGDQLFMTVDLDADRADVVETRALAEILAGKSVAAGKIEQMTLSLRADTLSAGGVEAHDVVIEGGLEQGQLNLRHLSVADLAGTKIDALGSIRNPLGTPSGNIEASINATDFSGAAAFLASFAPESALAQHLHAVAPLLSPMNAEISASGGTAGEPLSLALTGSFSDTHVTLEAKGAGSLDDLSSLSGSVALHADGEDSAKVLRQLGLAALPIRSTPLKLDGGFEGALASGGTLKIAGTVAGVDIDYTAETSLQNGGAAIAGDFSAKSDDIDPLLLLAGMALPGVGEGHAATANGRLEYAPGMLDIALEKASFQQGPVEGALHVAFAPDLKVTGTLDLPGASIPFLASLLVGGVPDFESGKWSDTPFAPVVPAGFAMQLNLSAADLDLGVPEGAKDAKLDVSVANSTLQLDLTQATFAGGTLMGTMSATLRDGELAVSLRGGLQGGSLQTLVWEAAGLPTASGKIDMQLEAVGRGRSLAGIVATLSGNGSFAIDDGRLNALNTDALSTVMKAAEGKDEPDEDKARETFASRFGSGKFDFGRAAGSFSLADGTMSVPKVLLEADGASILADATLDLGNLTLSSTWVVRVGEENGEAQPYVPVTFSGAIAAPGRQVDLNPLINLLRSRFLQRQINELDRLEAARRRADEAARQAAAERRDAEPDSEVPAIAPEPAPVAPVAPQPQAPLAQPASKPPTEPAAIEAGPDLPPPVDLIPERPPSMPAATTPAPAAPQSTATTPAPAIAPSTTPAPAIAPSTAPATAPATEPAAEPAPPLTTRYRILPNGTVVKVR